MQPLRICGNLTYERIKRGEHENTHKLAEDMALFTLDSLTMLEYGLEQVFKMAAFHLDAVGPVLGIKCERVRRTPGLFTLLAASSFCSRDACLVSTLTS